MISPLDQQVETMRARAADEGAMGAQPLARAAAHLASGQIDVFDDVLPDPEAYRAMALGLPYRSITVGAATFHGIAGCADGTIPLAILMRCPAAVPTLTFFRRSPAQQVEPNYIHTDRDMGEWTALLYLTPDPPDGDGTTFWRDRSTGAIASTAATDDALRAEYLAWRDLERWEPWQTVAAKFNRLVLFTAPLFHSRALPDNYGDGDAARLVQCVFGRGSIEGPRCA